MASCILVAGKNLGNSPVLCFNIVKSRIPLRFAGTVKDEFSVLGGVGDAVVGVVQVNRINRSNITAIVESIRITCLIVAISLCIGKLLIGGMEIQSAFEPFGRTEVDSGTAGETREIVIFTYPFSSR